jgi:CheY-like chemotaxis protein
MFSFLESSHMVDVAATQAAASAAIDSARPAPLVLVVDDNRDIRDSLKTLLGLLGHKVEVAADGVEGVERALGLRPRVALVDLSLPRLDGYQVARRLRAALGRDILLVAYTASGDPDDRTRALQAGFDLHLLKPLDWDLFTPWLAEALGG